MGRPCSRVNLEQGISLRLYKLIRQGYIVPGHSTGPHLISWSWTYTGERIATGSLAANLTDGSLGWLDIHVGSVRQRICMVRESRHFGGGQWYFLCPYRRIRCSRLWLPSGARGFGSRQTWGRQVAYNSQFQSRHDRALTQAQAIRTRLGGPDWAGIDEFDPPKPKGMRWSTYNRIVAKSRKLEAIADERLFFLIKQWGKLS